MRIFLLLFVLIFISCNSKEFESKEAMLKYLRNPENGYYLEKSVNGYSFSLMYRPTDLLVEQELSDLRPTQRLIDSLRSKYNKYIYFNLSMSKYNKELLSTAPRNVKEFGSMVNTLSFGIGEKVHLLTNKKDTLLLLDHVYPRLYGMGHSTTILFVYSRDDKALKQEYLNFNIEDIGLNTGGIKFRINNEIFYNEPRLKLNTN